MPNVFDDIGAENKESKVSARVNIFTELEAEKINPSNIFHELSTSKQEPSGLISTFLQQVGKATLNIYRALDPTQARSGVEATLGPIMAGMSPSIVPAIGAGETAFEITEPERRIAAGKEPLSPTMRAALSTGAEIGVGLATPLIPGLGLVRPRLPRATPSEIRKTVDTVLRDEATSFDQKMAAVIQQSKIPPRVEKALQKMGLKETPIELSEEMALKASKPLKTAEQALATEQTITKTLPENMKAVRLSTETTRKIFDAAQDWMTVNKMTPDPDIPVTYQVAKLISDEPRAFASLKESFQRQGVTLQDFSEAFIATESSAGRQLGQAGRLSQALKRAAQVDKGAAELLNEIEKAKPPLTGWSLAEHFLKRFTNLWRASLVTQWATAIRNFETQATKLGLDSIESLMDVAVNKVFQLGGQQERALGPQARYILEMWHGLVSRGKQRQAKILADAFPDQSETLFNRFASDVATSTALEAGKFGKIGGQLERLFNKAETGINYANFLNRAQEFLIRRAVFRAGLQRDLAKQGLEITKVAPKDIPPELISKNIDKALETTFALSPQKGLGDWMMRFYDNPIGKLASFIAPFPRFMYNAWKFQFEYSPAAFLKLLSPAERAAVAAGNPRAISKVLIGSALYYAAWEIRNDPELAGEKWYEIKSEDRRIDTRPFAPFVFPLFMAELTKRLNEGASMPDLQQLFQGLAASSFRAGAGLYVLDEVQTFASEILAGQGDPEKRTRKIRRLLGEIAGGFVTPLETFRQLYAEYAQSLPGIVGESATEEVKLREGREEPFLGPIKRRIPIISQELPEKELPLRATTPRIESVEPGGIKLSRQLTGISIQSRNKLEAEANRLGILPGEIYPRTGEAKANRLIVKEIGALSEKILMPIIESNRYQALSDPIRRVVFTETVKAIRAEAQKIAIQKDPKTFAPIMIRRHLPPRIRELLEQKGIMRDVREMLR